MQSIYIKGWSPNYRENFQQEWKFLLYFSFFVDFSFLLNYSFLSNSSFLLNFLLAFLRSVEFLAFISCFFVKFLVLIYRGFVGFLLVGFSIDNDRRGDETWSQP